jgi:hypothetical protein
LPRAQPVCKIRCFLAPAELEPALSVLNGRCWATACGFPVNGAPPPAQGWRRSTRHPSMQCGTRPHEQMGTGHTYLAKRSPRKNSPMASFPWISSRTSSLARPATCCRLWRMALIDRSRRFSTLAAVKLGKNLGRSNVVSEFREPMIAFWPASTEPDPLLQGRADSFWQPLLWTHLGGCAAGWNCFILCM